MLKRNLGAVYVLFAAFCWGLIGLFTRRLLAAGAAPGDIVAIRNTGALVMLAVYFTFRDRSVFHVKRRDLWIFLGTGVVSVLLFTLCYFSCQERCSLAVSAILLYTAPAMVVVMSAIFFKESITKRKLLALALALLGCASVSGLWGGGLTVTVSGFLFGIGSAFFYALYSVFGRVALKKYAPFTVVFQTFVFAGFAALFVSDLGMVGQILSEPPLLLTALGLALVSTVLPYIFYTRGLAMMEGGKASILASLEPVVAAFVGIFAFGEPLTAGVLGGLGCILGCVYILR